VVVSGLGPVVNPDQPSPWTVPEATPADPPYLKSGTTYWWRARSNDGTAPPSDWTTIWTYTPNQPPEMPADLSPPSGVYTSTTPTLSAAYVDADVDDQGDVFFEVYEAGTATLVASGSVPVLSGEVASWTVTPVLVSGREYSWRAQGRDGQSSPWTVPRAYVAYPAVGELPRYQFDRPLSDDDADEWVPPLGAEIGVNVATGNLLVRELDVAVEATGLDVDVERFYNSLSGSTSVLGAGWGLTTGTDVRIDVQAEGSVTLFGPTGFADTFIRQSGGNFLVPPGVQGGLVENGDGTYSVSLDDSSDTLTFAAGGRLIEQTIEDGTGHLLSYDGAGRLASITDSDGGVTSFHYDPVSGRLLEIVEPDEGSHEYEYDELDRLRLHRDPLARESTFAYTGGRLTKIVDRSGVETRFSYDGAGRVTAKVEVADPVTGAGPTTEYTYNADNTVVEEPSGRLTTYYAQQAPATTVVKHATAGVGAPAMQLTGTLAAQDGTTLEQSTSYALDINADDSDGVESLTIAVDDSVAEEVACEDQECDHTWSFDTSEHVPGEHIIRTLATDTNGNRRLRAIVVTLPPWEPPPVVGPEPEPTEEELLEAAVSFRETLGLNSNQGHIELVAEDPSAQAAVVEWGIPLQAAELEIVEDRQQLEDDAAYADAYVASSPEASAAYAGSYLDPSTGTLHVGFTEDAAEHLAAMAATFPQPNRLHVYTAEHTLADLEAVHDAIDADLDELALEGIDVRDVTLYEDENLVRIGVVSPSAPIEAELLSRYGPAIDVVEASEIEEEAGPLNRFARYPRIHAGLKLTRVTNPEAPGCTSNVSAFRRMNTGAIRYFHVTAGHCGEGYNVGQAWHQGGRKVGETVEDYFVTGYRVDGELIRATRQRTSTRIIAEGFLRQLVRIQGMGPPHERSGTVICKSGITTGVTCGIILRTRHTALIQGGVRLYRQRLATYGSRGGDSGSIVYRRLPKRKAVAVGIHSGAKKVTQNPQNPPRKLARYSHLRWAQNDMQIRVCIKGRVRCGR
jgi:YD repeat-containing protein